MPELATWLLQWRYVALAVVILLGNVGLPVPEETVLILAGYLVHDGHLAFTPTLAVGIASTVAGDNLGYWLGRLGGRPIVRRGARWLKVAPARLERLQGLGARHGALAVVAARFAPGFRMLAGPLAGVSGMRPFAFTAANLVGALIFVPYPLALGYLLGRGVDAVGPGRGGVGGIRWWVSAAAFALFVAGVLALARRRRRSRGCAGAPPDGAGAAG